MPTASKSVKRLRRAQVGAPAAELVLRSAGRSPAMSYAVYKVLHLLGILAVFTSLGAVAMLALRSGTDADEDRPVRKVVMMVHGIGLLVVIVAGFGLAARKGLMTSGVGGWPGWLYGKIAVWLALGAAVGYIRKSGGRALWWVLILPLLGAIAAWLAIMQPGGAAGPT